MSFQSYIVQGNLTRDPELKNVGATQLAKFAVAISRKFKDKVGELIEEVLFIDVAVWGQQAASCHQYLKKGSSALIQGYLKEERWDDVHTGAPKSKFVLYADKVVFLGSKKTDTTDNESQAPMPFGKADQGLKNANPITGQGEIDMGDMGLPF